MTGAGDEDRGNRLTLEAGNWQRELLPEADAKRLGEVDQSVIFDALVELAKREQIGAIETESVPAELGPEGKLMLPRTRIHIQAGAAAHNAIRDFVKLVTTYVIVGADPSTAFVGLTIDFVLNIFDAASHLDDSEMEVVQTALELRKTSGAPPTSAELDRALRECDDLGEVLGALKERGVLTGGPTGWRVTF